jgi:hypothetical protein
LFKKFFRFVIENQPKQIDKDLFEFQQAMKLEKEYSFDDVLSPDLKQVLSKAHENVKDELKKCIFYLFFITYTEDILKFRFKEK